MFFVDFNPQESNSEIFTITIQLHTNVKIEEPHKNSNYHIALIKYLTAIPELTARTSLNTSNAVTITNIALKAA
jgi:hypothetical protein